MMLTILKKYKSAVISAIITIFVGICGLFALNLVNSDSSIKTINNDSYFISYDSTWKLTDKKNDIVSFVHDSQSKVIIQISELEDKYKYSTIDELFDELIYNIQKQNKDYILISNKKDKVTKFEFDGYKLLFENDKQQVMIILFKKNEKLITIRYEAYTEYFDILLDSSQHIVNNLEIKDEKFNLKNELSIKTKSIEYSKNEKLDSILDKSVSYKIAKNNYLVEYSIPTNFELKSYDSTIGYYQLKLDEGIINITMNIYIKNIYEYLNKDEIMNVYRNYSSYHKDETNDYSSFEESISKLDNDYYGYIYRNSYFYNKAVKYDSSFKAKEYKRKDENIELIYALGNNRVLTIKIESTGVALTQKLIDMIKIKLIKNYSSYIDNEKENNQRVAIFKTYTDYNKNKLYEIALKIPDKYNEIDKNENRYLNRSYSLNYNDDMNIYDYNINYELSTLSDKSIIDIINQTYIKTTYGDANKLTYKGDFTFNGKQFKVYDGGYTNISGIIFTNINRKTYYINKKILFYEMPNKGNLYIEINGNGNVITEEMINELTTFTVEEKDL